MKILVVDQNINCLALAQITGNHLGMQIEKLQLPNQLPPAIEKIKHIEEEFALLFYEMYLASITDNYDYVLLDFQWIDALRNGQCYFCTGAFKALEKMQLVKQLILIRCDGIERPTFRKALEMIAA